jgi:hypothetical protein
MVIAGFVIENSTCGERADIVAKSISGTLAKIAKIKIALF